MVGTVNPVSIQSLTRACPGQNIPDCSAVISLATRIASSEGNADGWSGWMEQQIQATLASVAEKNRFTEYGVKCNAEGCVLFVAGRNSMEIFERNWSQSDDFRNWLSKQPWIDQLAKNSGRNDWRSPLAWQVTGIDYSPFVIWYVVTRVT
jgi:hypothetical protein